VASDGRSYHQYCGISLALDFVGERWTLLIVRDLMIGPRRYGDLLAGLPGVTTNLLAKRLRRLEELGLLEKTRLPAPATTVVYRLTPAGRELEPVLLALGAWGSRYMQKPKRGYRLDVGWLLFSLKRRFRGAEAAAFLSLRCEGRAFHLRVTEDTWDLEENRDGPFDAMLEGHATAYRALFLGGESCAGLVERGLLRLEGERDALRIALEAVGAPP
jgi:DNA-binding HxlR family transcriptional regulator